MLGKKVCKKQFKKDNEFTIMRKHSVARLEQLSLKKIFNDCSIGLFIVLLTQVCVGMMKDP